MADSRRGDIEQIRAEVLAGRYRPNLDRIAAAALADLSQAPRPRQFSALVLLRERQERVLALLALAERGVLGTCLDPAPDLDEMVALRPGVVIADPTFVRHLTPALEQALPETGLLLVGGGSGTRSLALSRPLSLAALEGALEAAVPSRLPRRLLRRVLVVEREAALVRALELAGREVVCAENAVDLFASPPAGPFQVAFPGPVLAGDAEARAALHLLFGRDLIICAA
jgi:hypothetical protein